MEQDQSPLGDRFERVFLGAKAQGAALRVEELREQVEALALRPARNQEEATWRQIKCMDYRQERERLYELQVECREADRAAGLPEGQCFSVTAKSPAELDAERDGKVAENQRMDSLLKRQPGRIQKQFRGRTFAAIRRDPRFRMLARQASPAGMTMQQRSREDGATPPRRRAGSSSRTSGTDPGDDGDGEPSRLAVLLGRPLANFVLLNADLGGPERLAKFMKQPGSVQSAAWAGLRDAIERRRVSEGVVA